MCFITMNLEPDEPLKTWGENPVEPREKDFIDDAIQIIETNVDLIEAKAVIREFVSVCKSALELPPYLAVGLAHDVRNQMQTTLEKARNFSK